MADMHTHRQNHSLSTGLILLCYSLFFAGFIFSFRAVSSISVGMLIIAGILFRRRSWKILFSDPSSILLLLGYTLYFLLCIISYFLHGHSPDGLRDIYLKSGILLIPISVILSRPDGKKSWQASWRIYILLLTAATLYCLLTGILRSIREGGISFLFYHELVKPLHQHAVYFSIYCFIALAVLFDERDEENALFIPALRRVLLIYFSVFLLLLSSKIVLGIYALCLLYFLVRFSLEKSKGSRYFIKTGFVLLVLLMLAVFVPNPASHRFRDVFTGDPALAQRKNYDPGIYFNGIQFRLLQWNLVPEVLSEKHSWWKGAGSVNAQPFLDDAYTSKNMWLGDPLSGDRGYRAFNTHNAFLESLLRYGIPGLILFGFIYLVMLRMIFRPGKAGRRFAWLLLLLYPWVESLFETQYGILLFCFFPIFLLLEDRSQPRGKYSRLDSAE